VGDQRRIEQDLGVECQAHRRAGFSQHAQPRFRREYRGHWAGGEGTRGGRGTGGGADDPSPPISTVPSGWLQRKFASRLKNTRQIQHHQHRAQGRTSILRGESVSERGVPGQLGGGDHPHGLPANEDAGSAAVRCASQGMEKPSPLRHSQRALSRDREHCRDSVWSRTVRQSYEYDDSVM